MRTILKGVLAAMMLAGASTIAAGPAQANSPSVGIYVGYGDGYYDRHRSHRNYYHRSAYVPRYCRYYRPGWYWRNYCRPYTRARYYRY